MRKIHLLVILHDSLLRKDVLKYAQSDVTKGMFTAQRGSSYRFSEDITATSSVLPSVTGLDFNYTAVLTKHQV